MDEGRKELTIKPEKLTQLEPVGVRILGDVDPAKLTEEQFNSNPHLLYHGAARQFTYRHTYDYRSEEYFTDNDGSQTLGEGFYTTENISVAENYSRVRQHHDDAEPVALQVLPYQARVLDLRVSTDLTRNAPVPADIFNKWYEHYKDYYQNRVGRENLPWYVNAMEAEYWTILNQAKKLVDAGNLIDLRVMLGTASSPDLRTGNWPSPIYMKFFANFMVEQGYDGLVYNEGGEGAKAENHPSYIFYKLEKVGTFDNWRSRDRIIGQ